MGQWSYPWNRPAAGNQRGSFQPSLAYNTNAAVASATLPAANLTGGAVEVDLALTGTLTGAATATTDTAANIIAAIPVRQVYPGFTYKLRILNQSGGAFTWTVAGGTGVTVTGTATIAQNTHRDFLVKIGSNMTTVTLQNVGSGNT